KRCHLTHCKNHHPKYTAFCSEQCALTLCSQLQRCKRAGCNRLQAFGIRKGSVKIFDYCGWGCLHKDNHDDEPSVVLLDPASSESTHIETQFVQNRLPKPLRIFKITM